MLRSPIVATIALSVVVLASFRPISAAESGHFTIGVRGKGKITVTVTGLDAHLKRFEFSQTREGNGLLVFRHEAFPLTAIHIYAEQTLRNQYGWLVECNYGWVFFKIKSGGFIHLLATKPDVDPHQCKETMH